MKKNARRETNFIHFPPNLHLHSPAAHSVQLSATSLNEPLQIPIMGSFHNAAPQFSLVFIFMSPYTLCRKQYLSCSKFK